MPRRLLALNVLLGGVSLACVGFIAWELVAPAPVREARPRPPVAAAPPPAPAPAPAPATAWEVVATRNVFSPTRSEAPATGLAGGAAPGGVKPSLYGVVLRDRNPIAYLEDPLTKRVAGYRVGDAIAGGTLTTIAADRVVIARPEGAFDVKLRDPSKPRPAAPPAPGPPAVLAPPAPGVVIGPAPAAPAGPALPQPPVPAPGTTVGPFLLPGGRPAPSLGRRLPVPPLSETVPQQAPRQ